MNKAGGRQLWGQLHKLNLLKPPLHQQIKKRTKKRNDMEANSRLSRLNVCNSSGRRLQAKERGYKAGRITDDYKKATFVANQNTRATRRDAIATNSRNCRRKQLWLIYHNTLCYALSQLIPWERGNEREGERNRGRALCPASQHVRNASK